MPTPRLAPRIVHRIAPSLAAVLLSTAALAQDATLVAPPADAGARRPVPAPADELTLGVYEVADLTGAAELPALDLPSPGVSDGRRGRELLAELEAQAALRARVRASGESLASALETYMEPPFEADRHQVRLVSEGILVVHGTAQQQAWVERFLGVQREHAGLLVDVQARVFHTPPGLLTELGVQGSASVHDPASVEGLLAALLGRDDVTSITAPRLLACPRQHATISVANQVAYVRDYELEVVEPGETEIADPVIDTISEGVLFEMRAVPLEPGRFGVEVDLTQTTLERPIPTKRVVIGAGRHSVTIGLPQVTELGVHARLSLEDGGTAVFVTPDQVTDRDLVTLVRVRGVTAEELSDEVPSDEGGTIREGRRRR